VQTADSQRFVIVSHFHYLALLELSTMSKRQGTGQDAKYGNVNHTVAPAGNNGAPIWIAPMPESAVLHAGTATTNIHHHNTTNNAAHASNNNNSTAPDIRDFMAALRHSAAAAAWSAKKQRRTSNDSDNDDDDHDESNNDNTPGGDRRARKREINRKSAQRKRERERLQLDALTDRNAQVSYVNEALKADNTRLSQLLQSMRTILSSLKQQQQQQEANVSNSFSPDALTTMLQQQQPSHTKAAAAATNHVSLQQQQQDHSHDVSKSPSVPLPPTTTWTTQWRMALALRSALVTSAQARPPARLEGVDPETGSAAKSASNPFQQTTMLLWNQVRVMERIQDQLLCQWHQYQRQQEQQQQQQSNTSATSTATANTSNNNNNGGGDRVSGHALSRFPILNPQAASKSAANVMTTAGMVGVNEGGGDHYSHSNDSKVNVSMPGGMNLHQLLALATTLSPHSLSTLLPVSPPYADLRHRALSTAPTPFSLFQSTAPADNSQQHQQPSLFLHNSQPWALQQQQPQRPSPPPSTPDSHVLATLLQWLVQGATSSFSTASFS
jgi:hypothetical protein